MKLTKFLCITLMLLPSFVFADDLKQQIEEEIASKLGIEQVAISPNNGKRFFTAQGSQLDSVELSENNTFKATIIDTAARNHTMLGRYEDAVKLVVASAELSVGKVIEESFLTYVNYPKSKAKNIYVSSVDDLIGKEPKHKIHAGKPILKSDLMNQTVIKKGQNIKIVFVKSNLTLQTDGIASENGGIGDFIKVKNSETNKVINAKVLNEDTVVAGS